MYPFVCIKLALFPFYTSSRAERMLKIGQKFDMFKIVQSSMDARYATQEGEMCNGARECPRLCAYGIISFS